MKNPFKRKPKTIERKPGTRTYGGNGTIHQTGFFDIETQHGVVVAVWFRCQPVPFRQVEVNSNRAVDMVSMYRDPANAYAIPNVVTIELEES